MLLAATQFGTRWCEASQSIDCRNRRADKRGFESTCERLRIREIGIQRDIDNFILRIKRQPP